jgi:hypothetical protein
VIGERLQHYFHSYKMVEGQDLGIEIPTMAWSEKAKKIAQAAMAGYQETFGAD